jgi:hypothetical protein
LLLYAQRNFGIFDFFAHLDAVSFFCVKKQEKMTNETSTYLKDAVGPLLARALAAAATAQPNDPVEYVALWLHHQLQLEAHKAEQAEAARVLEQQRAQWAGARQRRELAASVAIQREWRHHAEAVALAKRREGELDAIFGDVQGLDDDQCDEQHAELLAAAAGAAPPAAAAAVASIKAAFAEADEAFSAEASDAERELVAAKVAARSDFLRARLCVSQLDKAAIGYLKVLPQSSQSVLLVLRSLVYALQPTTAPKKVRTLAQVRQFIKPFIVVRQLKTYDPAPVTAASLVQTAASGVPPTLPPKRAITRIRRLMTLVNEDDVKAASVVLAAVHQWLNALVNWRLARDALVGAARSAGRGAVWAEEELEEEEPELGADGEPVLPSLLDAEEETVRLAEVEKKRQEEAEAAELAAEQAELEGEAPEDQE